MNRTLLTLTLALMAILTFSACSDDPEKFSVYFENNSDESVYVNSQWMDSPHQIGAYNFTSLGKKLEKGEGLTISGERTAEVLSGKRNLQIVVVKQSWYDQVQQYPGHYIDIHFDRITTTYPELENSQFKALYPAP